MLETNSYVHCLCIDFSKAFDTINHQILLDKISKLHFHPAIVSLISSFLFSRTQSTYMNYVTSSPLSITRSIVQGSGLGPILYIIYTLDLETLNNCNKLCLYADDTSLLVPQHSPIDISNEFENIKSWAHLNKMTINLSKTKQLLFRAPNFKHELLPKCIPDIEVVESLKLLGVFISSTFDQKEHVNFITMIANQRLYLLNLLKQNGLNNKSLDCIFSAIVLSRIIYAIEAWGGYTTKEMDGKINKMFLKARRWGLCSKLYSYDDIKDDRWMQYFNVICKKHSHCLFHLLPPTRPMIARLRPREHNHQVPHANKEFFRKSILIHSLIKGGVTACK